MYGLLPEHLVLFQHAVLRAHGVESLAVRLQLALQVLSKWV